MTKILVQSSTGSVLSRHTCPGGHWRTARDKSAAEIAQTRDARSEHKGHIRIRNNIIDYFENKVEVCGLQLIEDKLHGCCTLYNKLSVDGFMKQASLLYEDVTLYLSFLIFSSQTLPTRTYYSCSFGGLSSLYSKDAVKIQRIQIIRQNVRHHVTMINVSFLSVT